MIAGLHAGASGVNARNNRVIIPAQLQGRSACRDDHDSLRALLLKA
jgi:hypothetical protein